MRGHNPFAGAGLAAMLLATAAVAGDEDAIRAFMGPIEPRRGTMPNPARQSKAEQKRAKRARRNLACVNSP